MTTFKDLLVYQQAFGLALEIFEISKGFPQEERYGLTDQIRRSSRSVCANFGEAYRKRRYTNYFISKLSDCDSENTETQIWLDFALALHYLSADIHQQLSEKSQEVGRRLGHIIKHPERYC